jgi:uncharacterized membrane protein YkvA (DUF1232 family)
MLYRLLRFRSELVTLWRAFLDPATPLPLKALMLLAPLYLVMPLDLVPDFIPLAGWIDDAIVIPLLVSFIVRLLPRKAEATPNRYRATSGDGPVIEGTARRR